MKRMRLLAAVSAAALIACTPVYGASWVQQGAEYYLDDNGNKLQNTVSEDGYWVNDKGETKIQSMTA